MDLPLEPIGVPERDPSRNDDDAPRTVLFECEDIEPMIGAHVDRELTRAEEVRVEEHLDRCGRCRARREHLEALSSVLKGWEASSLTPVPPDLRLKNAVLARVAETSHLRRVDDRVLRFTNWAVAACVLVGLGLGVLLGTSWQTPISTDLGAGGATIHFDSDAQSLAEADLGARRQFDHDELEPQTSIADLGPRSTAEPLAPAPRMSAFQDAVVRRLVAEAQLFERRKTIQTVTGQEPVALYCPDGSLRYVPRDLIGSPGFRSVLRALGGRQPIATASATSRTTPASVSGEAVEGAAVADLLGPMQGLLNGALTPENAPAPTIVWPADGGQPQFRRLRPIEARGIRRSAAAKRPALSSSDGVAAATEQIQVVDPLRAQENGELTIEDHPSDPGIVILRVKGTSGPIYIPAGQVLAGGATDRVTATPLWLPRPRDGEMRFTLRCLPIRSGAARESGARTQLTRWIVGPSLRALLAKGVSASEFLSVVERQFDSSGMARANRDEFSLLALLRDPRSRVLDARVEWNRSLRNDLLAGFVFTNGRDQVLGMELVRFQGEAASKLLARLWVSYQFEAALRGGVVGAEAHKTIAREGRSMERVFRALRASKDVFNGTTSAELLRVSHADISKSRLRVQAAELGRRDEKGDAEFVPLHVSGMPRLDSK